jgi:hypothetical protein
MYKSFISLRSSRFIYDDMRSHAAYNLQLLNKHYWRIFDLQADRNNISHLTINYWEKTSYLLYSVQCQGRDIRGQI